VPRKSPQLATLSVGRPLDSQAEAVCFIRLTWLYPPGTPTTIWWCSSRFLAPTSGWEGLRAG